MTSPAGFLGLSRSTTWNLSPAQGRGGGVTGWLTPALSLPSSIYMPILIQSMHKWCVCFANTASDSSQLETGLILKDTSNKQTRREMLCSPCKCALRLELWCFLPTSWPSYTPPTHSLKPPVLWPQQPSCCVQLLCRKQKKSFV